jgi:hypothetical protein
MEVGKSLFNHGRRNRKKVPRRKIASRENQLSPISRNICLLFFHESISPIRSLFEVESLEATTTKIRSNKMHYRDGREAKNGDKIIQLDMGDNIIAFGVLEYGGLRVDQAKRFKEIELENARLKSNYRIEFTGSDFSWIYITPLNTTQQGR